MSGRLLVVQHEDDAPAAWFGEWIEAAGVELVVLLGHRGTPIPATLDEYDGLLVLGGAMGANDDATCPWLTPTKALIAHTIRQAEKAFLGICLGHQLAAVAVGGTVAPNPSGTTIGLTPVTRTKHGDRHPFLRDSGPSPRAMHWNDDVVTALAGGSAQVLANAPDGSIQAASFGPLAHGVQFHPEVSPEVFASWGSSSTTSGDHQPDPQRVAAAAHQLEEAAAEMRATWRPVAERFALMVTSHPNRVAAAAEHSGSPDWRIG